MKNYRVHPTHWLIYAQATTTATASAQTRRWRKLSSAALGTGLMASRAGARVTRDRFRKTGPSSTATSRVEINKLVRRVHPIIFTNSFLGDDAAVLARCVDGVEVDAAIQHEGAVKF